MPAHTTGSLKLQSARHSLAALAAIGTSAWRKKRRGREKKERRNEACVYTYTYTRTDVCFGHECVLPFDHYYYHEDEHSGSRPRCCARVSACQVEKEILPDNLELLIAGQRGVAVTFAKREGPIESIGRNGELAATRATTTRRAREVVRNRPSVIG